MNRITFETPSNDQILPCISVTELSNGKIEVNEEDDEGGIIALYPRQWLRVFSAMKWIKSGEIV